ncbi:unnamed protein product [Amoebophrya sp. A120]|nr:unnamed protein product [Amoebophrya sp. A120]|eukprot:GSA120T00025275001.1
MASSRRHPGVVPATFYPAPSTWSTSATFSRIYIFSIALLSCSWTTPGKSSFLATTSPSSAGSSRAASVDESELVAVLQESQRGVESGRSPHAFPRSIRVLSKFRSTASSGTSSASPSPPPCSRVASTTVLAVCSQFPPPGPDPRPLVPRTAHVLPPEKSTSEKDEEQSAQELVGSSRQATSTDTSTSFVQPASYESGSSGTTSSSSSGDTSNSNPREEPTLPWYEDYLPDRLPWKERQRRFEVAMQSKSDETLPHFDDLDDYLDQEFPWVRGWSNQTHARAAPFRDQRGSNFISRAEQEAAPLQTTLAGRGDGRLERPGGGGAAPTSTSSGCNTWSTSSKTPAHPRMNSNGSSSSAPANNANAAPASARLPPSSIPTPQRPASGRTALHPLVMLAPTRRQAPTMSHPTGNALLRITSAVPVPTGTLRSGLLPTCCSAGASASTSAVASSSTSAVNTPSSSRTNNPSGINPLRRTNPIRSFCQRRTTTVSEQATAAALTTTTDVQQQGGQHGTSSTTAEQQLQPGDSTARAWMNMAPSVSAAFRSGIPNHREQQEAPDRYGFDGVVMPATTSSSSHHPATISPHGTTFHAEKINRHSSRRTPGPEPPSQSSRTVARASSPRGGGSNDPRAATPAQEQTSTRRSRTAGPEPPLDQHGASNGPRAATQAEEQTSTRRSRTAGPEPPLDRARWLGTRTAGPEPPLERARWLGA